MPPVSQKTTGSYVPGNQSFSFTLTAQDGAPMPDGSLEGRKTVTVTDHTEAVFGTVIYSEPGNYSYRVQQRVGTNPNYSYDRTIYVVSVLVDQFNDGVLHYTMWVSCPGEEGKQTAIVFENKYFAPGGPTPPSDQGKSSKPVTPYKPTQPPGPDNTNKTDLPETGDDFNLNGWLALLILSGAGMCYFGYSSLEQHKKDSTHK